MMRLTRTGIGLLTAQYRSVLKKCFLINAGLFLALVPVRANATMTIGDLPYYSTTANEDNGVTWIYTQDQLRSIKTDATIAKNLQYLDRMVGAYWWVNGDDPAWTGPANILRSNYAVTSNLYFLDQAIGAKQTGTYITGANVYSNLKALDTQVAANTSTIAAHTAVINALDNNYYRNIKFSRAEKLQKTSTVIVRSAKHDVTIFGRKSDKTALCAEILQSPRSFRMTEAVANDNTVTTFDLVMEA